MLKEKVKHIAQKVSTFHSMHTLTGNKDEDTSNYFKEIFERLIMCQSELDFSL